MGKVLRMEHRFKDRKNAQYMEEIEQKVEEIKTWAEEAYPEADLKVFVNFSRDVGEELEIKNELRYRIGQTKHYVTSVTSLHRHTWSSPILMERFLKTFVQIQKDRITKLMDVRNRGTLNAE